jgi:hypothetical protein
MCPALNAFLQTTAQRSFQSNSKMYALVLSSCSPLSSTLAHLVKSYMLLHHNSSSETSQPSTPPTPIENQNNPLANLGHFAIVISTLLQRYVVDIAMNIESLKCNFM